MKLNAVSKVIEKSVLCQLCGKCFKTESWKSHHILMSHTNELEPCKEDGRFHCPLCPRRYKNMNSRSHHIVKTHFSDLNSINESSIIQYHLCKDTFANSHSLNLHLKLHAIHNSKPDANDIYMPQDNVIGMKPIADPLLFAIISTEKFNYNSCNSAPEFAFSQLPNNDQVLGMQDLNNQTMDNFDINLQPAEELAHSSLEKDLPPIVTPGQIVPNSNIWSPQIEQKQPDVGLYSDLASIMAFPNNGLYPGNELDNNYFGTPGSLDTNNLLVNFSSQQLRDMIAASTGELFTMPNMYGSGSSQSISSSNNYCFNITSMNAIIHSADTAHQKMLCARNMESFGNSVKFPGNPIAQQAQEFYTPDQQIFRNFPTSFANNISQNSL
ncbi:putative zinc finger protein [Ditylenchus destructor]|uniref:Zinc finger protein n=1 Tax=Ditylenchus destructor TaxID=166010 RepID=A0AAD4MTP4_9BILA|nr:putative zinc finger protein [Ditylenchus destructor]